MTEENLFDSNENTTSTESSGEETIKEPSKDNLFADQLSGIKNSDGNPKYSSVDKALEALNHSQEHILNLTNKNKELETENEKMKVSAAAQESVEDVVSRLTAMKNDEAPATPQPNVVNPAEINEMVKEALKNDRADQTRQGNRNSVNNQITKSFGDKAKEVVVAKAQELGTTPEKLGELSAENPQLVLALFAEVGANTVNPTSSSINMSYGNKEPETVEKPSKSLLQGATSRDQMEYMKKIKEDVYKKHEIKT